MREWFLFIFIPSFYFFCCPFAYIIKQSFSFHSDSPNDQRRVSHTDCPARINSKKRPKSTFSVPLWCFSHFTMKYQSGTGQYPGWLSYPWSCDPCVLKWVCCSCNLNSSNNIIPKRQRSPNSPRPWSSTPAAAVCPVSNAAGATPLDHACLTTAPSLLKLLKRYSSCYFPCQIRTGVDHGSDRAAANRFRSHSLIG